MLYPNLEAEMTRHSVTQVSIAELVGKTPETVSKWMNGRNGEFPVSAAMEVKREFFPGCDVEYLFDRKAG